MERLNNKKYHEVVGDIIKPNISKSFAIGNKYINKVPGMDVLNCDWAGYDFADMSDTKSTKLSEETLQELFFKTNLNIGDTNERIVETMLIKNKDYNTLMEIYKTRYPFSLLPQFALYTYCRSLCNKKLKKKDFDKIYSDLDFLENVTQTIEDNTFKKENVKVEIIF